MVSLKNVLALLSVAAVVCVGACQKPAGPLEKAGKAIDDAVEDVGDEMHDAAH